MQDLIDVSIHARHYWRASRDMFSAMLRPTEFQSTPAITGGRAADDQYQRIPSHRFNPRPPLLAGEPPATSATAATSACFNPRPPLLAGEPLQGRPIDSRARRFNPRPPLLAGEPFTVGIIRRPPCVSIHARHYWRASRGVLLLIHVLPPVSIHARHYWRASLAHPQRQPEDLQFQSTPAITGGRALPGLLLAEFVDIVSIHARHYWRASPRAA